jgi:uncharacterized protein
VSEPIDTRAPFQRNGDAVIERAGAEIGRLLHEVVPRLMESQAPKVRKYIRLTEIAEKVNALIAPNTPCRRGCSACCHIAVGISDTEAQRIAMHTGRVAVAQSGAGDLHSLARTLGRNIIQYAQTPCTFLGAEGECTIYAVRPVTCRTHHAIAPDAKCCDLAIGRQPVPQVNLEILTTAAAAVCIDEAFADIRAYFPNSAG